MPPVGFEPTISADERPKTYALDRAATGTGKGICVHTVNMYELQLIRIIESAVLKICLL